MRTKVMSRYLGIATIIYSSCLFFITQPVFAHCDTMDGPLIKDARSALEKKDVTPVLKWVKKEHESEIISAFNKTLNERSKKPEIKEKADMEFFETLVRVHREGEGASYAGLKPEGTEIEPAVAAADKALESGGVDNLIKFVTDEVAIGIRERFEKAAENKKHVNDSVESGREFVEAYVEFVHYVEKLHLDASGKAVHHGQEEAEAGPGH